MKISGSGDGSGFFRQSYESADPDPYQNITDRQQNRKGGFFTSHLGRMRRLEGFLYEAAKNFKFFLNIQNLNFKFFSTYRR
jgi:hypothetical protein